MSSCPFSKGNIKSPNFREKHRQSSIQFSSDIEDISTLNLKHLNEALSFLTNPSVSYNFLNVILYFL